MNKRLCYDASLTVSDIQMLYQAGLASESRVYCLQGYSESEIRRTVEYAERLNPQNG